MSQNLYLVFSKPPDDVSAEEYDRWYDLHVRENIVSPGFTSAKRFAVNPVPDAPIPFSHLAVYEYEGEDQSVWRGDLSRRVETGEIALPEWFGRITFGSWDCKPISARVEPVRGGAS